jgi:RsiW-degrading membrane proteinase PrsW (M82 family)
MKNRVLTVVAVLLFVLPFAAMAYELARREPLTTVAVFGGIALVLFATMILALTVSRPKPQ